MLQIYAKIHKEIVVGEQHDKEINNHLRDGLLITKEHSFQLRDLEITLLIK